MKRLFVLLGLLASTAHATSTFDNVVIEDSCTLQSETASTVPYLDSSKNLTSSSVTPTELGFLSGVTSSLQTQLNAKEPTITILTPSKGGTGQSSLANALNALLPSQTGNSGKFLSTDGSTPTWQVSGGTVTSVTASSPLFSSGGGTPNLTIQQANSSQPGFLSSADWTTFNSKQATLTPGSISTSTTGVTVGSGSSSTVGPNVTVNVQTASGSQPGLLSSSDWTTFNSKQAAGSYVTTARQVNTTSPLSGGGALSSDLTLSMAQANSLQPGYLSAADWTTFNNKLDRSQFNYITNPDADVDTAGWNVYNDSGNTVAASVVDQDITYTSLTSGNGGNGQTVSYQIGTSPYAEPPVITCPTGNSAVVKWYNGPTVSQNPTATVLKAAWDASCAATMATATITGTASNRQYLTGTVTLGNGGDTSPTNGTGGSVTGVTITRNTTTPLGGIADLDLGKDAASRQGMGVSTDFTIQSLDKGNALQISFVYSGSAAMVLGTSSDVRMFLYDVTNAAFIPITPLKTLAGPVSTTKTYTGQFTASGTSVNYRLIFHIATTNASAWDLRLHDVTVSDVLNPTAATQVPSVVLQSQAISGSVTDHMAVSWIDGASAWVPATSAYNGDYWSLQGFATNIVGLTADIYVRGYMGGFSFGPFAGYNQYVDPASAGGLTPLPSPFTDTYLIMGKAISATEINIQPFKGIDLIQTSGVPRKGGILTNTGANDGTGDVAIAGGTTGQFLMANTAVTNGLAWNTPVGTAPIVYTAATHAWSCAAATGSVAGCLAAADFTTFNAKASTASPAFTGTPTAPTAAAATNTTQLATTAFVTTADNLKANLASPTFTGDVNASTGNVLISTIGKGLQVKTGTNAKIGTATLVGGTATVANTSVTANSRIFLTSNTDGGTPGWLRVSAKTNATSFVITSSSVLDTSTVAWVIIESIP